jgi:hypothetical protein
MGIFDFLKKSGASGAEPFFAMEPRCVRYAWFTMNLPVGWQFTQADSRRFAVSGPGACSARIEFLHPRGFKMSEFDKHREVIVQIMRGSLQNPAGIEKKLMTGVLWFEATGIQQGAQQLRIALFNSRARNLEEVPPPVLVVTCASPEGAERTEAFCEALRSIEWK